MKTKKSVLILGAVLGLVSSLAHSQSSVTMYGVIDEGVHYVSNVSGGKQVLLDSLDGISGSRWGLTGKEDLGGGFRAIFTLESGVNINNGQFGQGGTAFGRQAFVGIGSDDYGTITAGRQYDMVYYFPEWITAAAAIGASPGAHPGDLDNVSNSIRYNNALRYMSPTYHGLSFGAEYSLGGVAGNFSSTSGYSFGAGYANGPVQVKGAFEYFKHPTSSPGTGWFTGYANGFNLLAYSLNSAYQVAQAYQNAVVAATYTIGKAAVSASYSNVQYANLGPAFSNGTAVFNNYDVGLSYQFSPSLTVGLEYDYMNARSVTTSQGNSVGNQHYNQVAFLVDYALSKLTDFYLSGSWQRASGTSSTGQVAVADIGLSGDSSNNHQMLYRLAIRHRF